MTSQPEDLPTGWIKTFDNAGNPFYVDTRANPPRSTWNHPCQDSHYSNRRRGFFGKLKDKAIGIKVEREAAKAQLQAQGRHHHGFPSGQPYYQQQGYPGMPPSYGPQRRRGGNALPLLGGMAGGLLLGELLDDDFSGADFGANNDFGSDF